MSSRLLIILTSLLVLTIIIVLGAGMAHNQTRWGQILKLNITTSIFQKNISYSSLFLYRISKIFRNLRPNPITSENIKQELSRDLKIKSVSRRPPKNGARQYQRRIMREVSTINQRKYAQQNQETSKKKSVKVKSFCSFNIGIGMVCKRRKSASRFFQISK